MNQLNLNDINNYKPCRMKQHTLWVCKPPKNTVIFNQLEQIDIILKLIPVLPVLKKRYFLIPRELPLIEERMPDVYKFIMENAYVTGVTAPEFVICGTSNELSCISFKELSGYYSFDGGVPIEENDAFYRRFSFLGLKESHTSKFEWKNCKGKADFRPEACVMPWQKIEPNLGSMPEMRACFVPQNIPFQLEQYMGCKSHRIGNDKRLLHGKGDFVVWKASPDGTFATGGFHKKVVNGNVFRDTFNNQGWSDKLQVKENNTERPKPHELFDTRNKEDATRFQIDIDKNTALAFERAVKVACHWYMSAFSYPDNGVDKVSEVVASIANAGSFDKLALGNFKMKIGNVTQRKQDEVDFDFDDSVFHVDYIADYEVLVKYDIAGIRKGTGEKAVLSDNAIKFFVRFVYGAHGNCGVIFSGVQTSEGYYTTGSGLNSNPITPLANMCEKNEDDCNVLNYIIATMGDRLKNIQDMVNFFNVNSKAEDVVEVKKMLAEYNKVLASILYKPFTDKYGIKY